MKYGNAVKVGALMVAGAVLAKSGAEFLAKRGMTFDARSKDLLVAAGCVGAGVVGRVLGVKGAQSAGVAAGAGVVGLHVARSIGNKNISDLTPTLVAPDLTSAPVQQPIRIGGSVPTGIAPSYAAPAAPAAPTVPTGSTTIIHEAAAKPTTLEYFGGKLIDGAATVLGKLVGSSGGGRVVDARYALVS